MLILAAAATAALVAWCVLCFGRSGFWLVRPRVWPEPGMQPQADIIAVVPARDEAATLPLTLPLLLEQPVRGVLLVDDASSDGTGDCARRLAADAGAESRLTVIVGAPPPAGWAGKVWALHQGVTVAMEAGPPEFLLFSDADIAHRDGSVAALIRLAREGDLDQVSVMARLRCQSRAERLLVPAFVYFFAKLFPFRKVNRPRSRTAAAAGGCILVRADALTRSGGLEAISGALIDDVALAGSVKKGGRSGGGRVFLGFAEGVDSVRPYPRLSDVWQMVARSAYYQLRYSPVLLAGTVVGMVLIYAVPPVAVVAGAAAVGGGAARVGAIWALSAGGAGTALMLATYGPMLRYYRLAAWRVLTLPVAAALYTAMTVDSARRHRAGAGGAWKGRTAPSGVNARRNRSAAWDNRRDAGDTADAR